MNKFSLAAFLLLNLTSALAAPALHQKIDDFKKGLLFQGKDLRTLWEDIATGDELDYILPYRHEDLDDDQMDQVLEPLLEAVGFDHQIAFRAALQTVRLQISESFGSTPPNEEIDRVLCVPIQDRQVLSETEEALQKAREIIEIEKEHVTEPEFDDDKRMVELLDPKISMALSIRQAVSVARQTIRYEKDNLRTASESERETYNVDDRMATLLGILLGNDGEAQLLRIQDVVGEARRTVTLGNGFLNGMNFQTEAVGKLQFSDNSYHEPSLKYLIYCAILAHNMEILSMLLELPSSPKYLKYALMISTEENRPEIFSSLSSIYHERIHA